jgi:hypothetical protein
MAGNTIDPIYSPFTQCSIGKDERELFTGLALFREILDSISAFASSVAMPVQMLPAYLPDGSPRIVML